MWIDVGLVDARASQNLVGLDFFYFFYFYQSKKKSKKNVDPVKEYHKYIQVMIKEMHKLIS